MDSTLITYWPDYLVALLAILLLVQMLLVSVSLIRMHQLQRARMAAERSADARSTLLAIMSHEIRNPLTGLLSVARMLRSTMLDETQQHLLEILDRSGEDLLTLLDDTLLQSSGEIKPGTGQYSDAFSPVAMLEHLVTVYEEKASAKGLLLTSYIDPHLPLWLRGDSRRINQILHNLLSNAIKFTSTGIIKLELMARGQQHGRYQIEFRVIDSGIGIADEVQKQLFRPFQQAPGIQQQFGGTGLGLSVSRELAQRMGGNLTLASVEGQGSAFTLGLTLLPASDHASLPLKPQALEHQDTSGAPLAVLVVDDSEIHRLASGYLLQSAGHDVEVAASASEALLKLASRQFDCVLLDARMPDSDGITAVRHIHGMEVIGQKPRLVVLSAWLGEADRKELLDNGADAICLKPLNLHDFHRAINNQRRVAQATGTVARSHFPTDSAAYMLGT